ncbi:uncharacterized protein OCT59_009740 [Rhizophagus irregularis]|uniref:uncharacterized protein n=1 Tax=Rhizophagus irregularis TaxID=588596 RepID=UPI0019EFE49C|nr:hypothetical protein OCT59_002379 [Rhizophagus irregularis]UZO18427.1 hypothetical protein OCT59_009740 [Rhizophagus irregularis]GET53740.1 hypothetical protein GLOIN_2v1791933 [Rhizophagus irregularis DAOM 181602=DAOM 197198]GET66256.1 hypothetical protein GLOIN_2v1791933 [Rhizophagus irregularis DAOM 181602=DAOM 197198]
MNGIELMFEIGNFLSQEKLKQQLIPTMLQFPMQSNRWPISGEMIGYICARSLPHFGPKISEQTEPDQFSTRIS